MAGGSGSGAYSPSGSGGSMPIFGSGSPSYQNNAMPAALGTPQQPYSPTPRPGDVGYVPNNWQNSAAAQLQQFSGGQPNQQMPQAPIGAIGAQNNPFMQAQTMQRPMNPYMGQFGLGINRTPYNPNAYSNPAYAAPRPPAQFQPMISRSIAPAAAPAAPQNEQQKNGQNDWQGGSGWSTK